MEKRLTEILRIALHYHASDIHLEEKTVHSQKMFSIELRMSDGGMKSLPVKPNDERLINQLAYQAGLDMARCDLTKSGSFDFVMDGLPLSLRYSVVISSSTRSGVIRIMNDHRGLRIENLSEIPRVRKWMHDMMNSRNGLVVLSGATGSGKTTSLYAMLESVSHRKIVTLEDPIEFRHDSFLQIRVNEHFTYAQGIREIMRQDPDIIMIGEIRDEEAASMAVRSALTGHLVVTSIHASDCKTAIHRLLDLGVREYDLKTVLKGISCQYLVNLPEGEEGAKTGIYELMDEKQIRYYFEHGTEGDGFISFKEAEEEFRNRNRQPAWASSPLHFERNMS